MSELPATAPRAPTSFPKRGRATETRPAIAFAFVVLVLVCASLACLCSIANAQTPPDAGSLLNQIRNELPKPLPAQPIVLQRRTDPAAAAASSEKKVEIHAIKFVGNQLIDRAELLAATAPWLGKAIDLNDLREITTVVAQTYRAHGWVVRTFLPPQDITDGVVTVGVVEAKFGGASIDGRSLSRVSPDLISGIVEHQQSKGAPIRAEAIDRALLLAGDVPGVSVNGNLVAGTEDGETILAIQAVDTPLLTGSAVADNTGSRSTGTARASANMGVNSLAHGGDQARADLVHTQGTDYARLAFNAPLGFDGLRIGANASALHYRLVADEFAALQASGDSHTLGVDLAYPLLRTRDVNIRTLATIERKSFVNTADAAVSSQYLVYVETLGLDFDSVDAFAGSGSNNATVTVARGHLDLSANPTVRIDGSGNAFKKLQWSFARRQQLSGDLSAVATWRGQWTRENLDSSEKFYLGGSGGVRAYPADEAGGSTGSVFTIELRHRIGDAVTLSGFYDNGRIEQYRDNTGSNGRVLSGNSPNQYSLSGYGLSLACFVPWGATLSATWARRIGNNPDPTSAGKDQDGSLLRNRFWVSAALPFSL